MQYALARDDQLAVSAAEKRAAIEAERTRTFKQAEKKAKEGKKTSSFEAAKSENDTIQRSLEWWRAAAEKAPHMTARFSGNNVIGQQKQVMRSLAAAEEEAKNKIKKNIMSLSLLEKKQENLTEEEIGKMMFLRGKYKTGPDQWTDEKIEKYEREQLARLKLLLKQQPKYFNSHQPWEQIYYDYLIKKYTTMMGRLGGIIRGGFRKTKGKGKSKRRQTRRTGFYP